jgi:5-methylcytosine-specific restriction endonuclease McrA
MKSPIDPDGGRRGQKRTALFRRDKYRCVYCGGVFPAHQLTADHVQPRMKQGDQSPGNLVTACTTCNTNKGGMPAWKFLKDHPVERENFLRYAVHVWPRLRRAIEEGVQ